MRYWRPRSTTSVMASRGSSSTTRGRVVGRKSSSEPASETRLNLLISCVVAVQDFLCQPPVGTRAFGRAGVLQYGDRREGGLGETDRVLDREVVDEVAEVLPHQLQHLLRVQGAGLEDGRQDARDPQLGVQLQAHTLDAPLELLHSL